jgi:hypothetical protein
MSPNDPETGGEGDLLVTLLAVGWSYRQAGEKVNLSPSTVKRRMADPAFRRRVVEARQEMSQAASGQLTAGMAKAARALIELLDARKESARLGAAKALLEYAVKLHEPIDPPRAPAPPLLDPATGLLSRGAMHREIAEAAAFLGMIAGREDLPMPLRVTAAAKRAECVGALYQDDIERRVNDIERQIAGRPEDGDDLGSWQPGVSAAAEPAREEGPTPEEPRPCASRLDLE